MSAEPGQEPAGDNSVVDPSARRHLLLTDLRIALVAVAGFVGAAIVEREDPLIGAQSRAFDVIASGIAIVVAGLLLGTARGRDVLVQRTYRWTRAYRRSYQRRRREPIPLASLVGICPLAVAGASLFFGAMTATKLLRLAADAGDVLAVGWMLLLAAASLDLAAARRAAFGVPRGIATGRNVVGAYLAAALAIAALVPVGRHHVDVHNRCARALGSVACRAHHGLLNQFD